MLLVGTGPFLCGPSSFDNAVAYTGYKVLFTALGNTASVNSMQIAEVELLDAAE